MKTVFWQTHGYKQRQRDFDGIHDPADKTGVAYAGTLREIYDIGDSVNFNGKIYM